MVQNTKVYLKIIKEMVKVFGYIRMVLFIGANLKMINYTDTDNISGLMVNNTKDNGNVI